MNVVQVLLVPTVCPCGTTAGRQDIDKGLVVAVHAYMLPSTPSSPWHPPPEEAGAFMSPFGARGKAGQACKGTYCMHVPESHMLSVGM